MSVQAPMHLRVLLGAFHPSYCLGNNIHQQHKNISFWDLNFMLKDRIGTFCSFEAALTKKVVWQIDIRSYGWQLNIRITIRPNVTRNFWEHLTTSNVDTFLLVYYCVV